MARVTGTMRFWPPLGMRALYVVGMWVSFDDGPWAWQWNVRESLAVLRSAAANKMGGA
jgi:hypothetical protein